MKTKTLFCAVALTASISASMAQSNVYSQNVVGYANVSIPHGYSMIANPLNAGNNSVSNIFSPAVVNGQALGSTVYTWTGTGFLPCAKDQFDGTWQPLSPPFICDPNNGPFVEIGHGFFYQNNCGAAISWVRNFTVQ